MQGNIINNVSADVYTPQEIAQMLKISKRKAYELCKNTKDFKVIHIGRSVRIVKESFDRWIVR